MNRISADVFHFRRECTDCSHNIHRPFPGEQQYVPLAKNGVDVRCKECGHINHIKEIDNIGQ